MDANPIAWADADRSGIAGFTLLEMLVVLAILAVITAIALPRLRLNEGSRLRAVAEAVSVDLRLLRDEAGRRGIATGLSAGAHGYVLEPSGRVRTLPMGIILGIEAAPRVLLPQAQDNIGFFPDGSSTGGVITLRQSNLATRLTVRGLDGRVRRSER